MRISVAFLLVIGLTASVSNTRLHAQTASSQTSPGQMEKPPSSKAGGFRSYTSHYKFANRDWNALTSSLRTANPPSDAQINSFVMAMLAGDPDSMTASNPDAVAMSGRSVCSAGFFRISNNGDYSLVASIDVNGRKLCNELDVIHRGANGLTIQEIFVWNVDEVNAIVRDVRKDGKTELVVPDLLSDYEGARCSGQWSRIFLMQSGVLVDESSEFRPFYNTRLAQLDANIQKAKTQGASDNGDGVTCSQMEADKIRRFLGIDPAAGEDRAIEWAKSGNDWLRRRGFAVLSDIGDVQSISALARFAQDSDPGVAQDAKFALDCAKKE